MDDALLLFMLSPAKQLVQASGAGPIHATHDSAHCSHVHTPPALFSYVPVGHAGTHSPAPAAAAAAPGLMCSRYESPALAPAAHDRHSSGDGPEHAAHDASQTGTQSSLALSKLKPSRAHLHVRRSGVAAAPPPYSVSAGQGAQSSAELPTTLLNCAVGQAAHAPLSA